MFFDQTALWGSWIEDLQLRHTAEAYSDAGMAGVCAEIDAIGMGEVQVVEKTQQSQ